MPLTDPTFAPAVELLRLYAGADDRGLQIVGRRRGEATVLTAAAAFEAARPWAGRVPPTVGDLV